MRSFPGAPSPAPDTRTRLLEATFDCVACHGFSATSTEHIARWAALGTGTLYRHFSTKAALLQAAFAHATALLQGGPAPDPPAFLLYDRFQDLWRGAARQASRHRRAFHYWRLFRATPLDQDLRFPRALSLGPFARVPHLLLEALGTRHSRHYHAWQMAAQWTAVLQYTFFEYPTPSSYPPDLPDPPAGPTPVQRLDQAYDAWWNCLGILRDAPAFFHHFPEEEGPS